MTLLRDVAIACTLVQYFRTSASVVSASTDCIEGTVNGLIGLS